MQYSVGILTRMQASNANVPIRTICLVIVNRWYAIMELHMFVALILHKFEFTLLDPVPKPVSGPKKMSNAEWLNKP